MINYDDVKVDKKKYSYISLSKLFGKKVVDLEVSVTKEFGENDIFVHYIVFEDDTKLSLNGEHDMVYIDGNIRKLVSNDDLDHLYEEQNK